MIVELFKLAYSTCQSWMFLLAALTSLWVLTKLGPAALRRRRMVQLIEKIPGPPALPLLGCCHLLKFDRWEFSLQLRDLVHEYARESGIIRAWLGLRPLVTATKADIAEPILANTRLLTKSYNYDILMPWLGTGLLVSGGTKWQTRRKLLTPTFHYSILDNFVENFGREAQVFVEQLQSKADTNELFNVYPYAKRCTLDIICSAAMGVHINAQLKHDSEYVKAVEDINEIVLKYYRCPWLWFAPTFYLSGQGFKYDRCLKLLTSFTRKVIQERGELIHDSMSHSDVNKFTSSRKKLAILDLLLLMAKENKLTYEDIREEIDTFMFEGHDTTASGLTWALYLLGKNPEVQDQAVEELRAIFGTSTRRPTVKDLKELNYLERVIKETLRLFPSVPVFGRKLTEDIETGGYTIPKDTTMLVSPYFVQRDPKYWGPQPDKFDPDNFLPEKISSRNPYSYIPFSAGPRNCIGQRFALLEEKAVLSTILRSFVIECNETFHTAKPVPELILRPMNGVNIRIFHRNL